MTNKKILLVTHVVFHKQDEEIHGSAHLIEDYLKDNKLFYIFLKHPLFGGFSSVLKAKNNRILLGGNNIPFALRPFWELFQNIKVCWENKDNKIIFIGVDPLNALSGGLAKKLKLVDKVVFYAPDYSEKRFSNYFLNYIYHLVDFIAVSLADQVWCVSQKAIEVRKKEGINKDKLFYIPNFPRTQTINEIKSENKDKYTLVSVGGIDDNLNYSLVVKSLPKLLIDFPKLKLKIIGPKDYRDLKQEIEKLKLTKSIFFTGPQPYKKVLKILKSSGIGLALYTDNGNYGNNQFGDSLKIREYLACGLPVITTTIPETSQLVELFNAGKVIKYERGNKPFLTAVEEILSEDNYKLYGNNAFKASVSGDYDRMIKLPMGKILI